MKYYINEIKKGNIAVDDTLLISGTPATAGSKMLENFTPLFTAEVVERAEKAGYTVSGKANVGEFGLDLLGETSYFGDVTEDGTLRGATAELVRKGEITAAINVDINGAPRRAAAVSGVAFVKPTYGTVSRYGVISAVASGETVGVTAKSVKTAAELLSAIAGHDDKDGTSLPEVKYEYKTDLDVKGMKVAVVKELADAETLAFAETLKAKGAEVEEISLDFVGVAQTAWQILMAAETTNNLSRFDGVKYGYRTAEYKNIDELYVKSRTEAFGFLTKATILYGSDVLAKGKYEACYDKSLRLRRVVVEKMTELFAKYDAVLTAVISDKNLKPYDANDTFKKVYDESRYTAIPSVTGLPAVVSGGVQIIGDYFAESKIMSLAAVKEEA
ncbi:MAG: hypothetical protein IIX30_04110 [Clostridia bacterium]|nr:hypothetical protein [Clostridia bacterium]